MKKKQTTSPAKETKAATITIPKELTNPDVIKAYGIHLEQLEEYGLIAESDRAEFNQIYILLQEVKRIEQVLKTLDLVEQYKEYVQLSKTMLQYQNIYSMLSAKYYVSPYSRRKAHIGELIIQAKQNELSSKNTITKLLEGK